MLVFRTQLAVTHIHDLAFEWSVYRVRLIFYCSKRHMALTAVKGLTNVITCTILLYILLQMEVHLMNINPKNV